MKKSLLFLLLTFFTTAFSQIRFEKGYVINNQNEKSEVLIKNVDWSFNPTEFIYKTSEDADQMTGKMKDIKEFGVDNFSKYIRFTGPIDQSTDDLQILDDDQNPKWEEKTVYLNQLVQGKRNLYLYNDKKIRKFFYSDSNTPVTQLIYKRYFAEGDKTNVSTNNEFRTQLTKSFAGENATKKIESAKYIASDLTNLFKKFNDDSGENTFESDDSKSSVNLYIKPGISFSSASINFGEGNPANVNFANKLSPRFGMELEYIFPFYKNKFGIFFEPTYQSYNQKGQNFTNNEAEIKYSVIEIPIGARYYFFLDKNSKIFMEGVMNVAEFELGENTIRYAIPGTTSEKIVDLKSKINFGFGIGYSYKNKFVISLRQYSNKNLSEEYQFINLNYKNLSIMAAYNIF